MSMKKTLVADWMTKKPITVTPKAKLPELHRLMREHKVRRLPVVSNEELVGIITLGDVREAGPSDATSLSIYELNYLIANLSAEDIMTQDPITVYEETTLHDAAKIMLDKKIGGLPVLKNDKIVGIITETDIFRAVVEIFD